MTPKQKSFAVAALRRASYRWPPRNAAMIAARVGRNQYKCARCKGIFKHGEVQKDHINPMVPLTGWENFDVLIERLLVNEEGWQILCKPCHKAKTFMENTIRKTHEKPKSRKRK